MNNDHLVCISEIFIKTLQTFVWSHDHIAQEDMEQFTLNFKWCSLKIINFFIVYSKRLLIPLVLF